MQVYLMGDMGERFGSKWSMNVNSPREVFQLIECQRSEFKPYLEDCIKKGVDFTIRYGEEFLDLDKLNLSLNKEDLIITPIPAGASGDLGKILAAIAIIAVVWQFPAFGTAKTSLVGLNSWGTVALAVASNLAIQGIQGMLLPGPETDSEEPDSYIFSGPENTFNEGQPVPILYGEMIIGGAPINVTYTTRKPSTNGFMYTSTETVNGNFVNNSFVATPMFRGV